MTIEDRYDVAVIGGGLAGLTAATYLARAGRRVAVVEKAERIGGRAATRDIDGFRFNLGPHALYAQGAGMSVLQELGVAVRGGLAPINGAFAARDDALHTLPVGPLSLLVTGLLPLSAKLQGALFMAVLPRLETARFDAVTVNDWVHSRFASEESRGLIRALVRLSTYADAPELQSAGSALEQLKAAMRGVLYLDGGWQSLVDGLRTEAVRAGAHIFTGRPTRRVLGTDHVTGIQLDDRRVFASRVLISAGPHEAADLVPYSQQLKSWADESTPVQVACLDVALERLSRPKALFALGIDQPLYASVHSVAAQLAPDGGALVHVARYGESFKDVADEMRRVLDRLQPGWRERVVHERCLPKMKVSHALVKAAQGGREGRPGPRVPGVAGLFVAGDWVGREGLLADASLASARAAARQSLAEDAGGLIAA